MVSESVLAASIIIPTCNRKSSLLETLRSLEDQSFPQDQYEVLVVDDGSIDDTAEIAGENFRFRFSYIYQPNQGAAVARNRGAADANGQITIFLDDDIRVEAGFVEGMVSHLDDETVVIGLLYPVVSEEEGIFEMMEATTNQPVIAADREGEEIPFSECLSGILAVQRDVFFSVGQMQDVAGDGRVAWGDVDFAYRAWKYGCRFWRSFRAVGHHYDFSTRDFWAYCKRWQGAAKAAVKLAQKHPDILSYLPMFDDKRPISWGTDSLKLIVKKTARRLLAGFVVVRSMEMMVNWLEKIGPKTMLLRGLYRWIVGAYIMRGYREGISETNVQK